MTRPEPPASTFFARPAEIVAQGLLGTRLVSTLGGKRTVGRIVETEAYVGPHDPASHAAERIGRTRRNATMYGPPGLAYVYRIYGIHWCLNVVTDAEDFPGAVLIRAIEPLEGVDVMRARRWPGGSAEPDTRIGSGPGRLAVALAITGDCDGHPLDQPPLALEPGERVPPRRIAKGPRIGITRAADWPLRFTIRGSPHLSR